MKLLHVSDTHGTLPPLDTDGDVIVHSGDLMPNRSFANRIIETAFQPFWVNDNMPRLKAWIGSRPFLYTPGNHDYIDPTLAMRDAGIDARLLCNESKIVDGVTFYGFPWTPEFWGWNWMCRTEELKEHLEIPVALMNEGKLDVLVSHGPMYGVLDRNADGTRCGSRELRDALQNAKHPPRLVLHGHIHEANGVQAWSRGVVVSNAACGQRVLEVKR